MEITEKRVKDAVKIFAYKKLKQNTKDFHTRDFDVFFSDGYGLKEYRTAFFCVKGSHNKLFGFTEEHPSGAQVFVTNRGKFYTDFSKVWINNGWISPPRAAWVIEKEIKKLKLEFKQELTT